jgi:hypothetical protein
MWLDNWKFCSLLKFELIFVFTNVLLSFCDQYKTADLVNKVMAIYVIAELIWANTIVVIVVSSFSYFPRKTCCGACFKRTKIKIRNLMLKQNFNTFYKRRDSTYTLHLYHFSCLDSTESPVVEWKEGVI